MAKINGNRRILSSIYKESGTAKPLSWVGFYKRSDLDGRILRDVLIAAGTTIQRVNSDGSLTSLLTGRTSGLYHTSARQGDLQLITNQNPDLVGEGDELVKYDGKVITKWGVVPPGSQETKIESFSDDGSFTISNLTTMDNRASDGETTFDGDAVSVTLSASNNSGYLQKSYTAFDIKGASDVTDDLTVDNPNAGENGIADRMGVWMFIPRGQLVNFDDTNASQAVSVHFATENTFTNFYRFDFRVGSLVEGWNFLSFNFNRITAPARPVGAAADPAILGSSGNAATFSANMNAVTDIRYEIFSKASTELTGIVFNRLTLYDRGAPNGSFSDSTTGNFSTGATSIWRYRTTFVTNKGLESNGGPVLTMDNSSTGNATKSDTISLTNIPISTDPQVVARRIYRTAASGSVYLRIATINDNTTTSFDDTIADTSLSEIQPPLAGDPTADATPPPQAGIVAVWKGNTYLAGDPRNPETLYVSADSEPEQFTTNNQFVLDSQITGIYEAFSGVVVTTQTGLWQVLGEGVDFLSVDKLMDGVGAVGPRGVGVGRMLGWIVDRDGVRLFDLSKPLKISENIRDIFDDLDKTNIEKTHSAHLRRRNTLVFMFPDSSGNYMTSYVFQYTGDDTRQGWWWQLKLPSDLNLQDLQEIEDSNGDFRLYAGGDDGMLYELFYEGSNVFVNAAGTETPITTKLRTKFMREATVAVEDQTRPLGRVQPRNFEMRHKGDATTWTVLAEMAEGPDQSQADKSTTLSMAFGSNNSLLRYPFIQGDLPAQEFMRFTLTNSDSNVSSILTGIRVYFETTSGNFLVTNVKSTS